MKQSLTTQFVTLGIMVAVLVALVSLIPAQGTQDGVNAHPSQTIGLADTHDARKDQRIH